MKENDNHNRLFYYWILALFVLSVLGFYLIGLVTVQPRASGAISGNGNPAIMIMVIVCPTYAVLLAMNGIYVYGSKEIAKNKKTILVLFISLLIFCMVGEIIEVNEHVERMRGGPNNPDSIIYRWGWFNQYTNTIVFNVYSFVFGVVLSGILGCLASRQKDG